MHEYLKGDSVWRRFLSALEGYAIILLDTEGHVATWNEGARQLKGYTADEAIGLHFSTFYTPEAVAVGHPQRELAVAASLGRYEEEGWRVRRDQTRFWAHVLITAIFDEHNVLCGYGKVLRDFTKHKQTAEQTANILNLLELTARSDYLTGLDNRRALDIALGQALSAANRHGRGLCLAMIDLDRFKGYNDAYGHLAGDSYLKVVADVWRKTLRPEDFICRYGGEEFVVGLPDTRMAEATRCLERLRAATPAPLTCSIGIAEWTTGESQSQLIGRADAAAYDAKRSGRNCMRCSVVASAETSDDPRTPG
jgi:diguanylate cyclase (GGDEF)-like protein/PAS domain S-box-containing protein